MSCFTNRCLRAFSALSVGLAAVPSPAIAQQYTSAPPTMAERQRVTQLVVRYIAAWNEPDAARRRALLAEVLVEDGTYTDPNRDGAGYQQIDALIASAQQAFPGYWLRLVSTIDTHHDGLVRFSWAAGGLADAPIYLAGTDFAKLGPDGRIQYIVGFGDAAAVQLPRK